MLLQKYTGIQLEIGRVLVLSWVIVTVIFVVIFTKINNDYRQTHIKQIEVHLKNLVLSHSEELANELFSGQSMALIAELKKIEESRDVFR